MPKSKKKPHPRQREAQHRGYDGSNDGVDKMMWDEDAPRREKAEADLMKTKKYAKGGMCRGGGKATRGLKFSGVK